MFERYPTSTHLAVIYGGGCPGRVLDAQCSARRGTGLYRHIVQHVYVPKTLACHRSSSSPLRCNNWDHRLPCHDIDGLSPDVVRSFVLPFIFPEAYQPAGEVATEVLVLTDPRRYLSLPRSSVESSERD
nr:hypothetical protein CFP56_04017 [Quercus suber]